MTDSSLDLKNSFHRKAIDQDQFEDEDHKIFEKKRLKLLFSKIGLTSSKGKQIENIDNPHIACLIFSISRKSKRSDNLKSGFHRKNKTREEK